MISVGAALAVIDQKIAGRRVPSEIVPVREAAGRTLAADQRSKLDLPPFDKAAVDGYAVRAGDTRDEYLLAGVVAAGQPGTTALTPGTTVKVMTGAPVPPGAAKVVMVEQATEHNGRVRLADPTGRSNICTKAEDVAVGQKVLAAGTRLGPLHVANLVGCGITEVDVDRKVSIAIISTGDEIVDCPSELASGKIINTNGPLLRGLAERWNLAVVSEDVVPDDKTALTLTLRRALADADIVVLSGGVSAGDHDFVPYAVADAALETHFSRVAVKPGMPTTFATGETEVLFGLAGNPVAVYLMFHLFVLRAAARLSGGAFEPPANKVRLAGELVRRSGSRTEYCPCRVLPDGRVERIAYHGSAHLSALLDADGFMVIPQSVTSLHAGTEVTFVTFGEVWGRCGIGSGGESTVSTATDGHAQRRA